MFLFNLKYFMWDVTDLLSETTTSIALWVIKTINRKYNNPLADKLRKLADEYDVLKQWEHKDEDNLK